MTSPAHNANGVARLGAEFGWVILGQALAGLGGLVGLKLLTRAMPPSVFGEFSLALTATILAQQCVGGPVGQAAIRYCAASREEGWSGAYLRSLNRLMLKGSGLLAALSAAALLVAVLAGQGSKCLLIGLTFLLAAATGYNIVFDSIQSGNRNRGAVALHQAALQWLRPLLALAMLAVFSSGLAAVVGGYLAATLLVIGSQSFLLFRAFRRDGGAAAVAVRDAERKLLAYAWPFASWGLLAWAQIASDRWFLEIFRDAPSVAAYTVCYQLGYSPIIVMSTAISNLAVPIIFQIAGSGSEPARLDAAALANRKHVLCLAALAIVVSGALALCHTAVFRLFTAPMYGPFSKYLPFLAAAAGVFAVAQALSLRSLIAGRSAELTGAKCLPALAGLVFNMAGAYWFGVAGAVAATLAFSVIYLAVVWRLTRRTSYSATGEAVMPDWTGKQAAEV